MNSRLFLAFLTLINWNLYSQDFYSLDKINEIRITFPFNNWDAKLDSLHTVDPDLRLLANIININGKLLDSVGIRFKGNSTYRANNAKNPFNIKLDYVKNQSYNGINTIKLSNAFMDPSFLREILGYYIAGQYMPVSKANFSKVYINNVYQGVFTNVEPTDKDFLRKNFENSNGAFFQCDRVEKQVTLPSSCPPMGSNSALRWVSEDSSCYFNSYEIESNFGWSNLSKFIQILDKNPNQIDSILDVDRAIWMLAFNNFYVNLDSYSGSGHNYFVYQDQNQRFNTILWDLNETYGAFTNSGSGQLNLQQMVSMSPILHSTNVDRPLISKLISQAQWKKRYIAHLRTIMDEAISSTFYKSLGLQLQNLIRTSVQQDLNKFYPEAAFISNLDTDFQINAPNGKIYPGLTSFAQRRADFLKSNTEFLGTTPQFISNEPFIIESSKTTNVQFKIKVENSNTCFLYYRENKYQKFKKQLMYDDGQHNDEKINDGIYGTEVSFNKKSVLQYYYLAENNIHARLLPERAEYEFLKLNLNKTILKTGDIVINEIMSSNTNSIADENGEYDDWIELYNTTNQDINLFGYSITDDNSNLDKWSFSDTIIKANDYLIIWADENSNDEGLHSNFKLSKSGEFIAFTGYQSILDSFSSPSLNNDISYGRCKNQFEIMNTPSPAKVNNCISLLDDTNIDSFEIFPNPANDNINIKLIYLNRPQIKLFSLTGTEINCNIKYFESSILMVLKEINSGIYILEINFDKIKIRRKIIKL